MQTIDRDIRAINNLYHNSDKSVGHQELNTLIKNHITDKYGYVNFGFISALRNIGIEIIPLQQDTLSCRLFGLVTDNGIIQIEPHKPMVF